MHLNLVLPPSYVILGMVLLSSCAEVLSRFAMRTLELRQGTQSSSQVLVVPSLKWQ